MMAQDFELFRLVYISDDSEYHVDADVPRMHERTYTYKIGELYGLDVLVDIYAATNENGDVIVYNETSGCAYTREQEVLNADIEQDGSVNLRKSLESSLEADAEMRFREELGLEQNSSDKLEESLKNVYLSETEVVDTLKGMLKISEDTLLQEPESYIAKARVFSLRKVISGLEKQRAQQNKRNREDER